MDSAIHLKDLLTDSKVVLYGHHQSVHGLLSWSCEHLRTHGHTSSLSSRVPSRTHVDIVHCSHSCFFIRISDISNRALIRHHVCCDIGMSGPKRSLIAQNSAATNTQEILLHMRCVSDDTCDGTVHRKFPPYRTHSTTLGCRPQYSSMAEQTHYDR